MVHLVDIDGGNWRVPLKVSKEQEVYVANSTTILARAYAYRDSRSRALLIYEDERPIGMVLYHDEELLNAYIFSELFIDEQFQGKGYGRTATKLVLDSMKKDGKYSKVILCYIEGNEAAKKLYKHFGFVEIDRDDDEVIMELEL
ncbi:MAG: GNAT family N-acetyltransferase [Oscillospiraceae bacterium]|nr:GNAT family N-acetyltransferase [Oscillospiraceae bacterium]